MRRLKENLFAKVEHIPDFGEALASYKLVNLKAIRLKLSPTVPAVNLERGRSCREAGNVEM